MSLDPLHQFHIEELYAVEVMGFPIQVTNQAVWMVGAVASLVLLFAYGLRKRALVPGRLQGFIEFTYEFMRNTVRDNTGTEGLKYLPIVMTVFLYVAVLNMGGLIPHSFTATSQLFVTGYLALLVFGMVMLVGFAKHGIKFLKVFWPPDSPWYMGLAIMPLEIISFFARPFTLAIRLAANMMAGHIMLKVFAYFIGALGSVFFLFGAAPLAVLLAVNLLECLVALLQAYIFAVLTCVYLNDALHLH